MRELPNDVMLEQELRRERTEANLTEKCDRCHESPARMIDGVLLCTACEERHFEAKRKINL